jgi:hypothetical protein
VEIVPYTGANDTREIRQRIPITDLTKTYTLSAWLKSSGMLVGGPTYAARLQVEWKRANLSSTGQTVDVALIPTNTNLSSGWSRTTPLPPADAAFALIEVKGGAAETATLWIDDVHFKKNP